MARFNQNATWPALALVALLALAHVVSMNAFARGFLAARLELQHSECGDFPGENPCLAEPAFDRTAVGRRPAVWLCVPPALLPCRSWWACAVGGESWPYNNDCPAPNNLPNNISTLLCIISELLKYISELTAP